MARARRAVSSLAPGVPGAYGQPHCQETLPSGQKPVIAPAPGSRLGLPFGPGLQIPGTPG